MKTKKTAKINVFDYFDYYEYLKDQYEYMKCNKYGFSLRSFAQVAGIPSHNYLLRIIQRKRKLSSKYLDNFCIALSLGVAECTYFKTLVSFNNEKNPKTKEVLLKEILSLRYRKKEEFRLEDKKLQFFQHWYYPVIRELVTLVDFQDDFNVLARCCSPLITAAQARSAVSYLTDNNFIAKKADGTYALVDYFISTGKEVNSIILRKYHQTTIHQAADAIDTIPPQKRDISSLTLRVNKETYNKMKSEIQGFRKHLMGMARESEDPEMVCFVGMQLLPRSSEHICDKGNNNAK